ncbi:hypothetical protein B7486_19570 [cyanobacterium TDX16]|nr:hypothetical protein B7486_19570 [cyanobacterium TDX16]
MTKRDEQSSQPRRASYLDRFLRQVAIAQIVLRRSSELRHSNFCVEQVKGFPIRPGTRQFSQGSEPGDQADRSPGMRFQSPQGKPTPNPAILTREWRPRN